MVQHRIATLAGAVVLAMVVAPACVTNKKFRNQTGSTDSRVAAVEGAVEANEKRLGDLRSETTSKLSALDQKAQQAQRTGDQAMAKAAAAESMASRAANGKLIWTVALTDKDVTFEFGKTALSSGAMKVLDGLVSKVKGFGKGVYLEIEGHTDATGSEELNEKLGHERASKVLRYLNQTGGIPLHAMNAISYGETQPIADNSTRAGRAQNRRVVIKVLE